MTMQTTTGKKEDEDEAIGIIIGAILITIAAAVGFIYRNSCTQNEEPTEETSALVRSPSLNRRV